MKRSIVGVAACLSLLLVAQTAAASAPAQEAYSTPAGSVQQQLGGGEHPGTPRRDSPASSAATNSGQKVLPFTGLDLGLVGAAGSVLLMIGLAIRRLSRLPVMPHDSSSRH